jgi:non-heme chloroperoxidase
MPYVLASDEVPLYYTSHGQGPVIVLIHGFSMNGGFFRHNVPELARGHRVVTMDLRGHGHSGKQEHNWTLPQAAREAVSGGRLTMTTKLQAPTKGLS